MNRQWERQYLMAHPIAPKPLGWRWYAGLIAEFVVALAIVVTVIALMSVV